MWFKWVITGIAVVMVLGKISAIGEQRNPIVPKEEAITFAFIAVLLVGGLLLFWR